jgi:hypothetical protein
MSHLVHSAPVELNIKEEESRVSDIRLILKNIDCKVCA